MPPSSSSASDDADSGSNYASCTSWQCSSVGTQGGGVAVSRSEPRSLSAGGSGGHSGVMANGLAATSVASGVAGMNLINEMFQRQARRLEAQLVSQLQDKKAIETAHAQLAAVQSHVQWHGNAMKQHAERLLWTEEAIQRMRLQLEGMREDHKKVVSSANALLADVNAMRSTLQRDAPERFRKTAGKLSDVASGAMSVSSVQELAAKQRDSSTDSSDGASGTNSGVSTTSTVIHSGPGALQPGPDSGAAEGGERRGSPPDAEVSSASGASDCALADGHSGKHSGKQRAAPAADEGPPEGAAAGGYSEASRPAGFKAPLPW